MLMSGQHTASVGNYIHVYIRTIDHEIHHYEQTLTIIHHH